MSWRVLIVLVAASCWLGCVETPGGASADTAVPPADAEPDVGADAADSGIDADTGVDHVRTFVEAMCERRFECQPFAIGLYYTDVAECIQGETARLRRAMREAGARFDPSLAEECPPLLATLSCPEFNVGARPPECRPHGTRAEGESCLHSMQCRSGVCYMPVDAPCGECRERLRENSPCDETTICGGGLYCKDGLCSPRARLNESCRERECLPLSLDCVDGFCVRSGLEGDACDLIPGTVPPRCDFFQGLYCKSGEFPTCQPYFIVEAGLQCSHEATCEAGNYCGEYRCEPRVDIGDSCEIIAQCPYRAVCFEGTCRWRSMELCGDAS